MKSFFTPYFQRSYNKLPIKIRKAFDKQFTLLTRDFRHPSVRAKKYDESRDLWQGRVTGHYRFYFEIKKDSYIFHEICEHN